MERFFIYAKPKITDIQPYSISVYNKYLTGIQDFNVLVKGKSFYDIRAVYLSASNSSMFENETFFNPFSSVKKLSAQNLPFFGVQIPFFIYKEKYLAFSLPQIPKASGYVDIIIENEAGYSRLTRDSRTPFTSAFQGAVDLQLPCVLGLKINDLPDLFEIYSLRTSDDEFILDSDTNEPIFAAFYS